MDLGDPLKVMLHYFQSHGMRGLGHQDRFFMGMCTHVFCYTLNMTYEDS